MWDKRSKILAGIAVVFVLASIFLLFKNRSLARKASELGIENQTLKTRNEEALRRAQTLEDLLVAFDVSFSKTLRPESEPKLDELVSSFRDPNIETAWKELQSPEARKGKPEFLALRVKNLLLVILTSIEESLR